MVFLENGHYEEALAFLSSNSYFAKEILTDEIKNMRLNIYLATAWSRLKKLSPDCKRAFQKYFEMKYGHCGGLLDKMGAEGDMNKHDVLIINDFETEQGKILSVNMLFVLKTVFGLDTFHHLEMQITDENEDGSEVLNKEEIRKFTLIVIILENSISENYRRILEDLNQPDGPKLLVISCGTICECPEPLKNCPFVDINASSELTKISTTSMEEDEFGIQRYERGKPYLKYILEKLFEESPDAVLKLFCHLVGEDFDKRCQLCQLNPMNTTTQGCAI